MPIAKLKAANTLDVMKPEEGNDSLDAIIKQAIGKESFLNFSRAGDSSAQFIQLLHALEQQAGSSSRIESLSTPTIFGKHEAHSYLSDHHQSWSLVSPTKIQMQKCDKCSREFCSPINYRRHIRVHHRLKKLDKDSAKSRDMLGAFWDKLPLEDAKEVVSFKNEEEVPGSSIIKALSSHVRKSVFSSPPHPYLKAGSELLDIVQARPSKFPISSQELFNVLDLASEKTFLSGPAASMQRYVFDGEAGKIGLEAKNLVACTSFLLEQKLVKAWLAEKDAEALRFQKLLVEEEEAAQKRQAELLERKKQKKLRQKEQKAKERRHEEKADSDESIDLVLEEMAPVEASSQAECDNSIDSLDLPNHIPLSIVDHFNSDGNLDSDFQIDSDCGQVDSGSSSSVEKRIAQGSGRWKRWQMSPKSQWVASNGSQSSKLGVHHNRGTHKDSRAGVSSHKVWSRKSKPETNIDALKARVKKEESNDLDQINNREVLIGSISVTLGNCSEEGNNLSEPCDTCLTEHQLPKNSVQAKPNKSNPVRSGTSRSTVKHWRPVSRNGTKVPNGEKGHTESLLNGNSEFSSHAAQVFLAQRWKEAIAADHVKLVITSDSFPLDENDTHETASQTLKLRRRCILGDAENRLVNVDIVGSSTTGKAKIKEISKQRSNPT
ncbi:uncharacterized protein LOC115716661 isoform X1 [Cannabis sativa]|uniref:uncharacterized protein LOC115716661 isoform X1 n=1 Tax=Cannabis sativa TaxID=3483 RepID=UPI0029CA5055|nr:uncharacterized protein LOC115716661 isoform X1 [Cannabis sativa]XP_060971367.1 uncharacterized protein LOC115716661 isoform X1 [Cannabis sativa]